MTATGNPCPPARWLAAGLTVLALTAAACAGDTAGDTLGDRCAPAAGPSDAEHPGAGVRIAVARSSGGTSEYFFPEIHIALLCELGYGVSEPAELELPPSTVHIALAEGDVDFWASTWVPLHDVWFEGELEDGTRVGDRVSHVGRLLEGGAIQGYAIEKTFADEFGIKTVDDLNDDPAAIARFDEFDAEPGNGFADFYGCPEDWTCDDVMEQQLVFSGWTNLRQVRAGIEAMFAAAAQQLASKEPFIFSLWTPTAYVVEMRPGEGVYWLGVEDVLDDSNPLGLPGGEEHDQRPGTMPIPPSECPSAADRPDGLCQTGWAPASIVVAANDDFLAANPAAAELLRQVTLPVIDVSLATVAVDEGVDSAQYAQQWLIDNRELADSWVARARAAA